MCRHIAYLGQPASPAWPLLEAPHSLRVQSYAPKDMRCPAVCNADGFGVGWYPEPGGEPVRYRRADPMWTDRTVEGLVRAARCTAFLAAVRSATVGMPVAEAACAPFADGRWLFSLNGMVAGWPDSMTGLARELDIRELVTLEAPTDAVLLWALLRRRLRCGADPGDALAGLTAELGALAPGSRLNLLLTDGSAIYATAWWHALSWRESAGAVVVSSEPYDDEPGWQPVPDAHLLVADRAGVRVRSVHELTEV